MWTDGHTDIHTSHHLYLLHRYTVISSFINMTMIIKIINAIITVISAITITITSRVRPPNGGRRPLYRRAAPVAAQTRRAAPVPDRCTDAPRRPLYRRAAPVPDRCTDAPRRPLYRRAAPATAVQTRRAGRRPLHAGWSRAPPEDSFIHTVRLSTRSGLPSSE